MRKNSEYVFALVATVGKILVGVLVFIATFVADDISVPIVFMLTFPLFIGTFSAGLSYMNSSGREVKRVSHDRKTEMSAIKTQGFNRQKYVADNLTVYGVCNMGTSLDEREIHYYEYSRMGL